MIRLFFLYGLAFGQLASAQSSNRYSIMDSTRYGYINESGQILIPPQFRSPRAFSENVAAVRKSKGLYGYIDTMGQWVIPPSYEYAEDFHNGLAVVYHQGKPFIINKLGEYPFKMGCLLNVEPFVRTISIVELETRLTQIGLLDTGGNWILPPIYYYIASFSDSLFVVGYHDTLQQSHTMGLVNWRGEWVIPLNVCYGIDATKGDFAIVEFVNQPIRSPWTDGANAIYKGIIDKSGKILFSEAQCNYKYQLPDSIRDSVFLTKDRPDSTIQANDFYGMHDHWNLMKVNGDVLFRCGEGESIAPDYNSDLFEIKAYDSIRAYESTRYYLDAQGKKRTLDQYDAYLKHYSKTSKAKPIKKSVLRLEQNKYDEPTTYDSMEFNGEKYEIPRYGKTLTNYKYMDTHGNIVWQSKPSAKQDEAIDIDWIPTVEYYGIGDDSGIYAPYDNGWIKNLSNSIQNGIPKDSLCIIVDAQDSFVYLINNQSINCFFDAMDNAIAFGMQAMDAEGNWKNIEKYTDAFCGNSRNSVELGAGQFWKFYARQYTGSFKTKLRFHLVQDSGKMIYSKAFDGNINPAQLWRRFHTPVGLQAEQ